MRNFEISLVVPFLLTIGGCSHNQRYYLDKGNVFFTERKYADAVLNYQNSIKRDPTFAEAFYRLGVAQQKVGDTQQAYQALHKAVELAPDRDTFRVELAEMVLESYQRDRRKPKVLYDQLADNAEYLLRKNANSFDGLRLRAAVLSIDGKFQEALLALRRANEVQPLDPKAVYPMVQVLFLQNQAEAAVQLGKQLIEAHKDFSPIYDVLAIYLSRNNRMGEAEALLNSRVANIPNDPSARLQLASFYLKLQQEPMVQQALQGILNKPKDFPLGHQIVGDFFANHARLDEAVREYREGSRSDSKSQVTYQKRIAKALISQGKRDDAIEELNQLVKVSPEDWDSRLARAILLRETGDPKKLEFARAELNALVAKIPGDEVAQYNLGLVYVAQGDNKSAHVRLQESARLRREYLPPRLALAEMAQKAGNYDEAIREATEILAVDPANTDARLWHAAGLLGNKAYQNARLELKALLREFPDSLDINLHMAVLDAMEAKYPEAETRYLRFYKPGQKDLRPMEGLIQVFGARRQFEKSLKLLETERKQAPDSRPVHLLSAAVATSAGKLDLAIQEYQWLQANHSKSTDVYTSLGDVYRLKGDITSALASYQRAKELSPNDSKVVAMVAYLEMAAGQSKQAIPNFQRQLALDPENAEAMNNLAFALADTGSDLDQALSLAERAQRKLPNNAAVADTIGWVYTKKGLNDSAVQVFNNLIKKYPDVPTLRYHLGVALLQQGKREEAKTQFIIGLSKKPPKEILDKITELVAKLG